MSALKYVNPIQVLMSVGAHSHLEFLTRCGTFDECENDWWHSTSDDPDCQDYKPDQNTLKDIHCTYCCTADNCNRDIKPAQDTLYMRGKFDKHLLQRITYDAL
ncbi:hypothetical protein DPMN_017608 [Dreissena polymorpha]|uniref:Uncharacterized protein n=1 Tax=Dreissena polymorpha TaxID=45954 RepID=A0A9D4S6J1_DREPO|nr:hypothetical protein DPMN_017608 [Dreissena polymorpha]